MKKNTKFSILAIVLIIASSINAQSTFKERMKEMKNAYKDAFTNMPKTNNLTELDQRNQRDIVAKHWEEKEYQLFNPRRKKMDYMMQKLNIEKNDEGKVTYVWFGTGKPSKYEASTTAGSNYSYCFSRSAMEVLCFTEKSIISYKVKATSKDKSGLSYEVTGINFTMGQFVKESKAKKYVIKQRTYANKKIQEDREAAIQAEKDRRAKYTLEGKKIAAIKPHWIEKPTLYMTQGHHYKLGFEVEFKDGTVDKTHNIGGNLYACDFKVETKNGSYSYFNKKYSTSKYGKISIGGSLKANAPILGGKDVTEFKISSKYDASQSVTIKKYIKYKQANSIYKRGEDGNAGFTSGSRGGRAGHGAPVTVKLTSYKHSEDGSKVYVYKCYDPWTGKTLTGRFIGNKLSINASGGDGSDGNDGLGKWSNSGAERPGDGGDGGNGGNGGDVKLIVDPSAKDVIIDCNVSAGNGGRGGRAGMCHQCAYGGEGTAGFGGKSGKSGSVKKTIAKVVL